jgi:hypothetical protein
MAWKELQQIISELTRAGLKRGKSVIETELTSIG